MKWYIDTEFDGLTLISIGMVRQDGKSFYAASSEFDPEACNPWVKKNVLPHLTGVPVPDTRANIALAIKACVEQDGEPPTFVGWYSAYDWVLFCELFGGMLSLPPSWPQICIDLRQELQRYPTLLRAAAKRGLHPGNFPIKNPDKVHDALYDAEWTKAVDEWLQLKQSAGLDVP